MIRIETAAWQVMLDAALAAYPHEACGILSGSETAGERRVEHALAVRNAFAGDPREGFLIEPEALLDADHAARALGQCVLGFFHSHPDRGVYFSETDLTQAWPGYAHVVLSIRQGRYAGAGAFRINSERTEASLEPMQLP